MLVIPARPPKSIRAAPETLWCCYAWLPVQGSPGKRTFFNNQSGDVLGTIRGADEQPRDERAAFFAAFVNGASAS